MRHFRIAGDAGIPLFELEPTCRNTINQDFTHSYVALGDGFAVKRKGADSNMVFLFALKRDACGEIAVSTYKSYQIERLECSIPAGMAVEAARLRPDFKVFGRDIVSVAFFDDIEEALSFLAG